MPGFTKLSEAAEFYSNFAPEEFQVCTLPSPASDESAMFSSSPTSSDAPSPASSEDTLGYYGSPRLLIVEQPVSKFRFRYRSEMQGAHGSLLGRRETSKKKTYPTVQLLNYDGEATIRCSLYTASSPYIPHMHQLISKENNKEILDHEIVVSSRNSYCAEFKGLGIVHMSKRDLRKELIRKKEKMYLEKLRSDKDLARVTDEELRRALKEKMPELEREATKEAKKMDANKVKLCFEAFVRDSSGGIIPVCEKPIFSETIQNIKSAETGDLKICRVDRCAGSCNGGDEVFILVEKVCKKNIRVRFFQLDDEGVEVWSADASFSDFDVHHQYAIVFRTPQYKSVDIVDTVQVFVELVRIKDNAHSEPITFIYKPARRHGKRSNRSFGLQENSKRYRQEDFSETSISSDQEAMSSDQDPMLSSEFSGLSSVNSDIMRQILGDNVENVDISQFESFVTSEDFKAYIQSCTGDSTDHINPSLPTNQLTLNVSASDHFDPNELFADLQILPGFESFDTAVNQCASTVNQCARFVTTDGVDKSSSLRKALILSRTTNSNDVSQDNLKKEQHNESSHPTDTSLELDHESADPMVEAGRLPAGATIQYEMADPTPLLQKEDTSEIAKVAHMKLLRLMKSRHPGRLQDMRNIIRAEGQKNGPLHAAVFHKQLQELSDLLSLIIKSSQWKLIDSVNQSKETPLMLAVEEDYLDGVKLLCMAGANVDCTNEREDSALHIAVRNKSLPCLDALLKVKPVREAHRKVNVDKKNEEGEAPIHIAVKQNDLESVKLLKAHGADVNLRTDKAGQTPLHLAVEFSCKEIIAYLLQQKNINRGEFNFSQRTAQDLVNTNQKEIAALFGKEHDDDSDSDEDSLHIVEKDNESESESDEEDDVDIDENSDDEVVDKKESPDVKAMENVSKMPREQASSDEEAENEGVKEFHRILTNKTTLDIVGKSLDQGQRWKALCAMLKCSFLVPTFLKVSSPTCCLLEYLKFNEVEYNHFREAVYKLKAYDAIEAMDNLLEEREQGRKFTKPLHKKC